MAKLLLNYRKVYGLRTVESLMHAGRVEREQHPRVCLAVAERWSSAAASLAPWTGHPGRPVTAIIHQENGQQPYSRADRPGRAGGAVMQRPSGIASRSVRDLP
ncbi:hypothetical protein [Pseudomonas aeruginosa]|uniref:hypothetical protein n=1 Tax=Pseudomonas aeruginosa TaxID=287 RepID=UPI001F14F2B3|nr:hypothetical protein [Pseudomonas aeruginosa]